MKPRLSGRRFLRLGKTRTLRKIYHKRVDILYPIIQSTFMDLTPENKNYIDGLSYESLLARWRFAPAGDPWFQGETGEYWGKKMSELRTQDPGGAVRASKTLGWG